MLIHREALELAKNCAADGDGVPFTMTCVHLDPSDGSVTVTDGRHFLRMRAAADEPNLFDDMAAQQTEELETSVLIPGDVVQAFNAAMKKRKAKKGLPTPHVVVARADDRVTLKSSDGKTTRTFLIDGVDKELKCPDVNKVVAGHKAVRTVTLGIELLDAIVRVMKACKVEAVTLGLPELDTQPITVSAFTENGPIDGALMAMSGAAPAL